MPDSTNEKVLFDVCCAGCKKVLEHPPIGIPKPESLMWTEDGSITWDNNFYCYECASEGVLKFGETAKEGRSNV
jgi:hypothetical protein